MNGYTLMANSYKKAAEQGRISDNAAQKNIRIYDFLASCDPDDICILFDSGAFNDILKAYVEQAANNLVANKTINNKASDAFKTAVPSWLSVLTAEEVLNCREVHNE